MMALDLRRRFYAEEIAATSGLASAAVVDALATVPRERFLAPGPWTVRGEADFQAAPRLTPDADPQHVYHNYAIAIDPSRQLFNGAPGLLAMAIDRLRIAAGDRVLHIGAGTGYYTAVMGSVAGPSGRIVAVEVDHELAATARENLASMPWIDVRAGDGSDAHAEHFDAILVNAGVTHPLDAWLDALAPNGRMILPLTVEMSATIGKGPLLSITRQTESDVCDVRIVSYVAIYSALGIRDDSRQAVLGLAMKANPMPALKRLRRDSHTATPTCWLHAPTCCLSTE